MESISLSPSSSSSSSSSLMLKRSNTQYCCSPKRRNNVKVYAKERGPYGSDSDRGLHVEESMIILRKRIKEMKVMEHNNEPPAEWTEWEKQQFVEYEEFICGVVGSLQLQLMNTRPSLALGMLLLVSISVPVSAHMVVSNLIEAANRLLSSLHLG